MRPSLKLEYFLINHTVIIFTQQWFSVLKTFKEVKFGKVEIMMHL